MANNFLWSLLTPVWSRFNLHEGAARPLGCVGARLGWPLPWKQAARELLYGSPQSIFLLVVNVLPNIVGSVQAGSLPRLPQRYLPLQLLW